VIKTLKKFELKVWIQINIHSDYNLILSILKIPSVSLATCLFKSKIHETILFHEMALGILLLLF
jgi:hypothetical protein